jgi:hypothetical protein
MALRRKQLPKWTTAARDLSQAVQYLLDDHSVRYAFTQVWGDLEAGRRIGQLEALVRALDVELSSAQPDRSIGRGTAALLAATLALTGQKAVDLVTADVYAAITGAEDKAAVVVQCVDQEVEGEQTKTITGKAGSDFGFETTARAGSAEAAGDAGEPSVEIDPAIETEEALPITPSKSRGDVEQGEPPPIRTGPPIYPEADGRG